MHLSRGIPGTHKIGPTLDGGQGLFIESWDSEFEGHRPFFRLLLEELWYASPGLPSSGKPPQRTVESLRNVAIQDPTSLSSAPGFTNWEDNNSQQPFLSTHGEKLLVASTARIGLGAAEYLRKD